MVHNAMLIAGLAVSVSALTPTPSVWFPSLQFPGFDLSKLPSVPASPSSSPGIISKILNTLSIRSATTEAYPNARRSQSSGTLHRRAAALPPRVKSTTYLGNVTDPGLDRDSCGSSRVGGRLLWVCRDTLVWDQTSKSAQFPLIQNTAGWTNWSTTSGAVITPGSQAPVGAASNGKNPIYQMSGQSYSNPSVYYPLAADMCPSNGICSDGTRWVYWPNSPPLITTNQSTGSRTAVGYTWIAKLHLDNLTPLNGNPPYTLFKTTWPGGTALPTTSVVADQFWKPNEIGFGDYGGFIRNGYAYLYGLNNASQTLLARVPTNSIENRTAYQYWYQNTWSTTLPAFNNTNSTIPNAGLAGQGTFYYSSYYQQYLWIGKGGPDNMANFYLTYAPQPQGPWSNYQLIFSGQNANGSFVGAYSHQAHPYMLPSSNAAEAAIYLTWTVPNPSTQSSEGNYWTPLVYLQWV